MNRCLYVVGPLVGYALLLAGCGTSRTTEVRYEEFDPTHENSIQTVFTGAMYGLNLTESGRVKRLYTFWGDFLPGISATVWFTDGRVQTLTCNRYNKKPVILCFDRSSGGLLNGGCETDLLEKHLSEMFPYVPELRDHFLSHVCASPEADEVFEANFLSVHIARLKLRLLR